MWIVVSLLALFSYPLSSSPSSSSSWTTTTSSAWALDSQLDERYQPTHAGEQLLPKKNNSSTFYHSPANVQILKSKSEYIWTHIYTNPRHRIFILFDKSNTSTSISPSASQPSIQQESPSPWKASSATSSLSTDLLLALVLHGGRCKCRGTEI